MGEDKAQTVEKDWYRKSWRQGLVEQQTEGRWLLKASVQQKEFKELDEACFCFDVSIVLDSQDGEVALSSRACAPGARYRLGTAAVALLSRLCPGCSTQVDNFGDHARSWPSLETYGRHNDLHNRFFALCQDAALKVELKVGPPVWPRRVGASLSNGLFEEPEAVDFAPLVWSSECASRECKKS